MLWQENVMSLRFDQIRLGVTLRRSNTKRPSHIRTTMTGLLRFSYRTNPNPK
jgi:hypothetical protein